MLVKTKTISGIKPTIEKELFNVRDTKIYKQHSYLSRQWY